MAGAVHLGELVVGVALAAGHPLPPVHVRAAVAERGRLPAGLRVALGAVGEAAVIAAVAAGAGHARRSDAVHVAARAGEGSDAESATGRDGGRPAKKKLSYLEAREYATIDGRIAQAEADLTARRAAFEDPAIASDGPRLMAAQAALEAAQKQVDELIARWAELEEKSGG